MGQGIPINTKIIHITNESDYSIMGNSNLNIDLEPVEVSINNTVKMGRSFNSSKRKVYTSLKKNNCKQQKAHVPRATPTPKINSYKFYNKSPDGMKWRKTEQVNLKGNQALSPISKIHKKRCEQCQSSCAEVWVSCFKTSVEQEVATNLLNKLKVNILNNQFINTWYRLKWAAISHLQCRQILRWSNFPRALASEKYLKH